MGYNNNNKVRKNWFQMQKERFGEEFLSRLSTRDIDNNRLRILQDIARGNFDINEDLVYLADQRIIGPLIDYAARKTALFTELSEALNLEVNTQRTTPNTAPVLNNVANVLVVYSKIWEHLETFKLSPNNNPTGQYDITVIMAMQDIMSKFREYIDLNRCL